MSPLGVNSPNGRLASQVAATATLRHATLTPDDVLALAAVEATNGEVGRQVLPITEEIAANARMHARLAQVTLEGLRRHKLVESERDMFGMAWRLTGLGREVLAELIRRERKGRPRSR